MPYPVFEVRNVRYRYNEVIALDGVTLTIASGQRIALLGANGSGKSTLLRILDALYFPEQGHLSAFGEPISAERMQDEAVAFRFRRRVGMVFQNPDVQLFNATVFDELAFGPLQLRWPPDLIRRRVAALLDFMALTHLKDRPPHRLSGGEKKRVALASVFILDPDVLLLDEPTAALDPQSQSQMIDLLMAWGSGVKTIVTATHDLDIVEDIADRCYILQDGRIAATGAPCDVLRDTPLLRRTRLLHAHRHAEAPGDTQSPPRSRAT